jgi:hypothetical protein
MYYATDAETLLKRCKAEGKSKADTIQLLAELCLDWPYVWASQGEQCTPEWRRNRIPYCREQKYADMIRDNCPVLSRKQSSCAGCKWYGCKCFDCQGFVHWLFEQVGIPLYGGGATTQWTTSSNWVAKGTIKDIPLNLTCCLFKQKESKMSHEGLSLGDGEGNVIHCSTIVKRGNIYVDRPAWTHWGIPPGLYTDDELRKAGITVDENKNIPTLRRGNSGDYVKKLQELLNANGATLVVDGKFGVSTENAVKTFQQQHKLKADGIVGKQTWKELGVTQAQTSLRPAEANQNRITNAEIESIKDEIKAALSILNTISN